MDPEEIRKKAQEESRLFDGLDYCWAVIFGILAAWLGVNLAERLGAFEGAVVETFLGEMNFTGMAILLVRIAAFVVTFLVTLYLRKKREEK